MQNIHNQTLIKSSSYINGQWLEKHHEGCFEVINPATQQTISSVSEVTSFQVDHAIIAASGALSIWQALPEEIRAERLNLWQNLLRENIDDLSRLLTLEQGKPLAEAKAEILHAASYLKLYSELVVGFTEPKKVNAEAHQQARAFRKPVGVVAAITPWNFPCSMVIRKAGAALAAGCSVVLKPSELTPLTALAIAQLSLDAGIPAGVFNVVVGSNAQAIGEILTQHPKIAKISFTGSTRVGKKLLQQCALGIKRTSMELGGNAAFIIFDDTNLDHAIIGAIASKFRNAGQTCISANRFLVHKNIAEEFTARLMEKINLLVLGNGVDTSTQIGPLINNQAVDKVNSLVEQAKLNGGKILFGGEKVNQEGSFFEPTIITNITPDMNIFKQEIFGPVVSIIVFDTEQQAIDLANQTDYGLCSYLYTNDQQRIDNMTAKLHVGMLGVNAVVISNPSAPFGGVKQSGMGREGGHYGIEEYLDYQYICQVSTSI